MKILLLSCIVLFSHVLFAQNLLKAKIVDAESLRPLIGANAYVTKLDIGASSGSNGNVDIKKIPDGTYTIRFSYVGYETLKEQITFPNDSTQKRIIIKLEKQPVNLGEVTVSSTRTENRIADVPTRVEVLGTDEVNEEIGIKPGNISKLLGETTGILVQQTSPATGSVTFRIQGLPGRYTQLLSDGFPLYSGFSGELSLLQIPPLDLKQVEVIKGSASSLYGAGSIGGIVNLISKKPTLKPKWSLLLNITQKGEKDISSFYTNRKNNLGITFLTSYSAQKALDINHNGFTDIPKFNQLNIAPKIFYYIDDLTSIMGGVSISYDTREGGDIFAIQNTPDSLHRYVYKNKSVHTVTRVEFDKSFGSGNKLTFKNSWSRYSRNLSLAENKFKGIQYSSFSELSYLMKTGNHKLVAGLNFNTDQFAPDKQIVKSSLSFNYNTLGAFLLDDWTIGKHLILEPSFRTDYQDKYKIFYLPHISIMYKFTSNFYTRLEAGTGYQIPSIFSNIAEERGYQDIAPIGNNIKPEKSFSTGFDINYNGTFWNAISLTLDQSFYYTKVNNSLTGQSDSLLNGMLLYKNSIVPLEAKGFDTNMDLTLGDLELFADYTFTDAYMNYKSEKRFLELTPKNKLNLTLTYEQEDDWRTGVEAFYTGSELLNGGAYSPDYWLIGVMFEKMFDNFSIVGNVENLLDVRQTKFEKIVIPPYSNPTFKQLYAPLDGMVANIAVKISI